MYRYLIRFIYILPIITNLYGSHNVLCCNTTQERDLLVKSLCREVFYLTEERTKSEDFRRLYARLYEEILRSLNCYDPLGVDNIGSQTYEQNKNRFSAGVFYLTIDCGIKTSEVFKRKLLESPGFLLENFGDQSLLTILYGMGKIDENLYLFAQECLEKLLTDPSSFLNQLENALSYMELQRTNMHRTIYRNFCEERDQWIERLSSLFEERYLVQISSKL